MLMKEYVLKSLTQAVERGDLQVSSIVEAGDGNSFLIVISGDEATPTVAPPVEAKPERKKPGPKPGTKPKPRKRRKQTRIKKAVLYEMILDYLPSEDKFARTAKEIADDMKLNSSHIKSRLNEMMQQGTVKEITGFEQNQRFIKVVDFQPPTEEENQEGNPPESEPEKRRRLRFRVGQSEPVKG